MRRIRAFAALPLLQSAAMFAITGVGFVVATLAYGFFLDADSFGHCVLMMALCLSAVQAAPSGVNAAVVRFDLRPDARVLLVAAVMAAVFSVAAAAVGYSLYDLSLLDAAILAFAVIVGGTAVAAKSALQRKGQFKRATLLWQSANAGLLVAVVFMAIGWGRNHWMPVLLAGIALLVTGALAWSSVLRSSMPGRRVTVKLWPQGLNLTGLGVSTEIFAQLDRLLLPLLLGYNDLALFALLSAVVLTPFRMLEMSALSTLAPRLRQEVPERRLRLLLVDVVALAALCTVGGAVLLLVGPWIYSLITSGPAAPVSAVLAIVVSGFIRVLVALTQGVAVAFGSSEELGRLHLMSWLSVGVSLVTAGLLKEHGLEGVIYGVACGWLFKAVATLGLTLRHLRAPKSRSVAAATVAP